MDEVLATLAQVPRKPREKEAGADGVTTQADRVQLCAGVGNSKSSSRHQYQPDRVMRGPTMKRRKRRAPTSRQLGNAPGHAGRGLPLSTVCVNQLIMARNSPFVRVLPPGS